MHLMSDDQEELLEDIQGEVEDGIEHNFRTGDEEHTPVHGPLSIKSVEWLIGESKSEKYDDLIYTATAEKKLKEAINLLSDSDCKTCREVFKLLRG